jgi:hypothetical protein
MTEPTSTSHTPSISEQVMHDHRKHDDKTMHRITILMSIVLVLMGITSVVAATAAWMSVSRSVTSTVTVEQVLTIPPVSSRVCAGQVVTLGFRIRTMKVPSIVAIRDNWRSDDLGYNVILESDTSYSVVSKAEDFTRELTLTIPMLPPGRYAYVRSAQEDGAPISIAEVPFVIEKCP